MESKKQVNLFRSFNTMCAVIVTKDSFPADLFGSFLTSGDEWWLVFGDSLGSRRMTPFRLIWYHTRHHQSRSCGHFHGRECPPQRALQLYCDWPSCASDATWCTMALVLVHWHWECRWLGRWREVQQLDNGKKGGWFSDLKHLPQTCPQRHEHGFQIYLNSLSRAFLTCTIRRACTH